MGQDDETLEALIRPGRPLSGATVRVIEGKARGAAARLLPGEPLSIGKSPDNMLHLEDITVSRYHAELVLKRSSIEVRDLDSTNGTYAEAVRISHAFVRPASVVTIGTNTMLLTATPNGPSTSAEDPEDAFALPDLIARSSAMRKVMGQLWRLVPSEVSVLFFGETGTGKEVLARALHDLSARRDGPFELVDCGSMAPNLVASELFGHERGAFTGAHRLHLGAFERADGGTLFLDEIGELPLHLQPMLLGVLERRSFRRLGSRKERRVDVRIMSATHRDLRKATNHGTFRPDLYFRLAVARVVVPPLRDRPEDIAPLVAHFAHRLTGSRDRQPFDGRTLRRLETMPWGGNVRELRNMVESSIALGPGGALVPGSEDGSAPRGAVDQAMPTAYRQARARAMGAFEGEYLRRLLHACGGNLSEAARRAGMDRHHLLSLARRHGLR